MSVSRKTRKAKPLNLEDQPQILQFITEGTSDSISQKTTSKKRRRSTGEKPLAKKQSDTPCTPASNPTVPLHTTPNTVGQDHIISRMSNMQMEDSATISSSASLMLEEIMKMEARLTASITTNRDKEISDMEMRLNANIRSTIDTSIKDALKVMQTSICTAVQNNPLIQTPNLEIKGLREENFRLNRKVQQLSAEQVKMKRQLNKIETKNLDRSMIIRGISEDIMDTEASMIEKIHRILLDIMNGDTDEVTVSPLNCNKKLQTIREIQQKQNKTSIS